MATNKDAENFLIKVGYSFAHGAIQQLVEAGFIAADPEPEKTIPEKIAQAAKVWLWSVDPDTHAAATFDFASGWSTDSWRIVLRDSDYPCDFQYPSEVKYIFAALVLLAHEAEIDL